MFLKNKCYEHGKLLIDVCEAYTSKTHPETGEIRNIGGAKTIKLSNGDVIDRDLVGSRNILLRDLVDTPERYYIYLPQLATI
jgi:putative transposase